MNDTPTISFNVLRKIADHMKNIPLSDVLELFEECGVPNSVINKHEGETKTLVYHALKTLALSKEPEDENILKKLILASLNPALYADNSITKKDRVELYNQWLKEDAKETIKQILRLGSGKYLLNDTLPFDQESEVIQRQDAELANKIFMSVLKSFKPQIKEVSEAYLLLISIIDELRQQTIPINRELNEYYLKLFKIVEDDINYINNGIEKIRAEALLDNPASPIGDIELLYKNRQGKNILYKPFINLYLADEELKKAKITYYEVKRQMNICFGYIIDITQQTKSTNVNHDRFTQYFDSVSYFLKNRAGKNINDYFGFEGSTFWLKRVTIDRLSIDFHIGKKHKYSDSFCFLEGLIAYLKEGKGKISGVWLKAEVPQSYLINNIKNRYEIEPASGWSGWLKQAKHALSNKMTDAQKDFIRIDNFHNGSYPISIHLPLDD